MSRTRTPRADSNARCLARTGFLVGAALLLCEATLQLAVRAFPAVELALVGRGSVPVGFPDDRIGYRPNPEHPEHDAKGFRNPAVPERADVVILGDSQCYGTGVAAEEAWPRRLAALSGLSVYSMAFPGWGPANGLLLLDEALALRPRVLVQAYYAGNDLFDTAHLVYGLGRLPELRTTDSGVAERVAALEADDPILERALRAFAPPTRPWNHLLVYALLSRLRENLADRIGIGPSPWERARTRCLAVPARCEVYEADGLRTLFTPGYRQIALDFGDPRIVEGERIALAALERMHRRAQEAGVHFVVLLIPTKELVFARGVGTPALELSPTYWRSVRAEEGLWLRARAYLEERSVPWIEALPALRQATRSGDLPYRESTDGHPNALGHRALAEVVLRAIESRLPQTEAPAAEEGRREGASRSGIDRGVIRSPRARVRWPA